MRLLLDPHQGAGTGAAGAVADLEARRPFAVFVNLPVLLDYLHNRDHYSVLELAERLRVKGQESFRLQRAPAA